MTTIEIIKEVKGIKADLLCNKIEYKESIDMLYTLSSYASVEFSILYNAFYSSKPEIYFIKTSN